MAINTGILWGDAAYIGSGGVNHVATVTGAVYSENDGTLMGFYIADSGRHMVSDMTRYVSIEDFRAAANVASAYAIYTLEPLKLWDEDINATGNALNNTIIGNRGEDVLNGLRHINYEAKPIIFASFAIVKNRVQFARKIWLTEEVNGMNDESWRMVA